MIKHIFIVTVFAVLHFMVSFFLVFASGSTSKLYYLIPAKILAFPLSVLSGYEDQPFMLGWILWILMSFCWGTGIYIVLRKFV